MNPGSRDVRPFRLYVGVSRVEPADGEGVTEKEAWTECLRPFEMTDDDELCHWESFLIGLEQHVGIEPRRILGRQVALRCRQERWWQIGNGSPVLGQKHFLLCADGTFEGACAAVLRKQNLPRPPKHGMAVGPKMKCVTHRLVDLKGEAPTDLDFHVE